MGNALTKVRPAYSQKILLKLYIATLLGGFLLVTISVYANSVKDKMVCPPSSRQ